MDFCLLKLGRGSGVYISFHIFLELSFENEIKRRNAAQYWLHQIVRCSLRKYWASDKSKPTAEIKQQKKFAFVSQELTKVKSLTYSENAAKSCSCSFFLSSICFGNHSLRIHCSETVTERFRLASICKKNNQNVSFKFTCLYTQVVLLCISLGQAPETHREPVPGWLGITTI